MMKHVVLFLALIVSVSTFAQDAATDAKKPKEITLQGYVVDQMCAKSMAKKTDPMQRAAKHTKECALEDACAASGFGLFYGDKKWVNFDENGSKLALAMFEKSKKGSDFKAEVKGELKGDKLIVSSLQEVGGDDVKKPAKETDHHHQHNH